MKQIPGLIGWKDSYKINISTLDAQHKQLFNAYSDLNQALKKGLRPALIQDTLNRLQTYVARHFAMEEKYMKESGFPGLEKQIKAHKYFSVVFSEILVQFNHEGLTPEIVKKLQTELAQWLVNHVTELDKEFGRFYSKIKQD